LNAGPNTRRFPAIVLLLIGCLPPTELHLIKAPENRGPPHCGSNRTQRRFGSIAKTSDGPGLMPRRSSGPDGASPSGADRPRTEAIRSAVPKAVV